MGLFGFLSIVGAFIIFGWLLTFQLPELLYPLVTLLFYMAFGLGFAFVFGLKLRPFRMQNFIGTVFLTILNVTLIWYINGVLLPLRFDLNVVNPQLFGVLVGVAEECLRIGLILLVLKLVGANTMFGAVLVLAIPAVVWATLHIARYGATPAILFFIFIVGCVLNASIVYTGNADGSIFGHAGVNYLVLGFANVVKITRKRLSRITNDARQMVSEACPGKFNYNKKGVFLCFLLLLPLLSLYYGPHISYGIYDALAIQTRPAIFEKRIGYAFMNDYREHITTYKFFLNGSLLMWDNEGTEFHIPAPSFQPNGTVATSILKNNTHCVQIFDVANGTLALWIVYDFDYSVETVKVALNGTTNDEDSELELEFENPRSLPLTNTSTSLTIGRLTYDWADLVGATDFEAYSNRLKIKFASAFNLDPSIVSASQNGGLRFPIQRKLDYVNDYYLAWYLDSNAVYYRTSADGGTWGGAVGVTGSTYGYYFSTASFGTAITYALYANGLKFRQGVMGSGGVISWRTAQQTIYPITGWSGKSYIAHDSTDKPYIIYNGHGKIEIIKSSLTNGTWKNATGYPQVLNNSYAGNYWGCAVVPLANEKMYAFYSRSRGNDTLSGRLYNGTAWEAEQEICSNILTTQDSFSVVSSGDVVHVAYAGASGNIHYLNFTYGVGWASETVLTASAGYPSLSLGSATSRGRLYLFHIEEKTVYHYYFDGVWNGPETVEESNLISSSSLNTFYEEQNDNIGVMYQLSNNPYTINCFMVGTLADVITDPVSVGGSLDGDDLLNITDIITPPITIPPFGYWLIGGSVVLVGLGALFAPRVKTRKARGAKRSSGGRSRGVSQKTVKKKKPNIKKRNAKGQFKRV